MKGFLSRLTGGKSEENAPLLDNEEQLSRQVNAILSLVANIYGADKLVLKAGKLDAISLIRSEELQDRVLALQKIVFEDPTIDETPSIEQIPGIIADIEDALADLVARRNLEEKLEKKIAEKMQQRHEDYIKEVKMQIIKEDGGPETPQTQKRFDELNKLEERTVMRSASEKLRPQGIEQVIGQERAIKALMSKIATPYPQHVILYGPPGVGKTTVARLAMDEVKKLPYSPFDSEGKFIEVDGSTLRWDPREVTNPLLGSVHDPIYQGARRELAEGGVPEPKPGLVTDAHGGILFIDEIGELEPLLQSKLLKVLEDKRVTFDSAYYDPNDPNIPQYIRKLFTDGAPADFLLIGATTREPSDISPALRSRCAEVFFDPLAPADIQEIVIQAAARLSVKVAPEISAKISEYTMEGRKATGILADSYSVALHRTARQDNPIVDSSVEITLEDLNEVIQVGRYTPVHQTKASDSSVIGRVHGLGVYGFLGSVIEIEAMAHPAKEAGKGRLRFNETAGSMAKDSVFNAGAVVRTILGIDIADYDVHINIIGGGNIDGPSAGTAIVLSLISAIKGVGIRQDVAITGEVSIQGKVKAVGGIHEKVQGAVRAGMKKILVPFENAHDVNELDINGVQIVLVSSVSDTFIHIFNGEI